jgi:hypothetical protein
MRNVFWMLSIFDVSFVSSRIKQKEKYLIYFKNMFDFGIGIFSSAKRNKERSAVCKLYGAKNSVAYSTMFSGFMIKTD